MKIQIASVSPRVHLADPRANADEIIKLACEAADGGASIVAFPELAVTGYSCGDLFLQDTLISAAKDAVDRIVSASADISAVIVFGAPVMEDEELFSCALVAAGGSLLGTFYKTWNCDDMGLVESRYFSAENDSLEPDGTEIGVTIPGTGETVTMAVIMGDVDSISGFDGDIVVNISEGAEYAGRLPLRLGKVRECSTGCIYVLSGCGFGESTTDFVYTGIKAIAQGGRLLAKGCARHKVMIMAEADTADIEESRAITACSGPNSRGNADPRIPYLPDTSEHTLEHAFDLQARGLLGRMEAIGCRKAVIGISGGLDSTLALLVTVRAFELAGYDRSDITAVTMPCFGTSETTRSFALSLMSELGVTYREVDIRASVMQHLADIGHDPDVHNTAFENAQARERTQVLMDLANDLNAIVVGTGDMSEIALGWCTYNGDHMSMYGVNCGVPKTLVRMIVRYVADTCGSEKLSQLLYSILDIPVSPELIPGEDGAIGQKTEDILGPYEIHDFILYYAMVSHMGPKQIYGLAAEVFGSSYSDDVIRMTVRNFYRRFFSSQFKRSCSPDGPMILSFSLSPRGGLMMPSDVSGRIWKAEAEEL
ncbi:MAG: NAD(+) synthase [Lachnospiraceae bacterium]|nr:NAD(+) synthase [Lachnospiraceae bacterium]